MYSDIVKNHFANPRNVKEIPGATAVAEADNPVCGDIMKIFVNVVDGVFCDVGVKTRGCPAAVAAGSVLSEMLIDLPVAEAVRIETRVVDRALGGLPRNKQHATDLAVDALRAVIHQFQSERLP